MFSNKLLISCCSSSPHTCVIWMLERLKLSRKFLSLSSCFWIFVSSFYSGWMFISSFCSKLLMSPNLLPFTVSSLFIFLYFTLHSLHISLYFATILKHFSVLNSASDRLAIFSLLSSIFGALICSFIWAIFLLRCTCYIIKGRALGISQGRATQVAALWHCM